MIITLINIVVFPNSPHWQAKSSSAWSRTTSDWRSELCRRREISTSEKQKSLKGQFGLHLVDRQALDEVRALKHWNIEEEKKGQEISIWNMHSDFPYKLHCMSFLTVETVEEDKKYWPIFVHRVNLDPFVLILELWSVTDWRDVGQGRDCWPRLLTADRGAEHLREAIKTEICHFWPHMTAIPTINTKTARFYFPISFLISERLALLLPPVVVYHNICLPTRTQMQPKVVKFLFESFPENSHEEWSSHHPASLLYL